MEKQESRKRVFRARKMFLKIIDETTNVKILKIKIYSQSYKKKIKILEGEIAAKKKKQQSKLMFRNAKETKLVSKKNLPVLQLSTLK
jgi:hypothetical protein